MKGKNKMKTTALQANTSKPNGAQKRKIYHTSQLNIKTPKKCIFCYT